MLTYYFIIVFLISIGITLQSNRNRKVYLFICLNVLILISGFRGYECGGDLNNYIPLFNEVTKEPISNIFTNYDKYGIIFKLVAKISSILSNNTTWILLVFSFINISIPIYFIYKYSKIPWMSVTLYIALTYYTNTFNSVRSSMALAIGMLGIIYLLKEKKLAAIFLFIIAFEIHKTIFPIFLSIYLIRIKPSFWKITISVVSCIILAKALSISGLAPLLDAYNEMNNYTGRNDDNLGGGGYSLLLLYIIITYGCYFLNKNRNSKLNNFLICLMCMATCIQAFAPMYSLLTRISYFFTIYSIVLIPNSIDLAFTLKSKRICVFCTVLLSLLYFQKFIMTPSLEFHSNSQGTIPYYYFWENKPKI